MPSPLVIATWPFGRQAAETAGALLLGGASPLDAALAGAQKVEDDPAVRSVGVGAMGNAVGEVSRDACVMDGATLNCGAVAGLEHIRHAAAVAKCVMEKTPHVLLVGDGALWFALQEGFKLESHHTPESVKEWHDHHPRNPVKPSSNQPILDATSTGISANDRYHDTVTVLATDGAGRFGGACTTSGTAYKLPGRVGDSPVIGAGLYVDDEAGAAGGTGFGEEIIRISGAHFIIEQLRAGATAQAACEAAIRRVHQVARRRGKKPDLVCFIALDRQGSYGAACTPGSNFDAAVFADGQVTMIRGREVPDTSR